MTEAISEPGSGSQWWSLSSSSKSMKDGGYRINARKSFVTSAGYADLYLVSTCAPGSDDPRKHALFAVEATKQGISNGPWDALGLRGTSSGAMQFDLETDAVALIFGGGDDQGLRMYNEVNQPLYHLAIGAVYLGITDALIEETVNRVKGRCYNENASGYGTQLSDFPISRRHIGEMEISRFALQSAAYQFASEIDAGCKFADLATPMTALKVLAAEISVAVGRQAMMASGGAAYSKGVTTIERNLRNALAASLMGPNDDFCKELIGRLTLGIGDYHALG